MERIKSLFIGTVTRLERADGAARFWDSEIAWFAYFSLMFAGCIVTVMASL